jgi:hypothetical protein
MVKHTGLHFATLTGWLVKDAQHAQAFEARQSSLRERINLLPECMPQEVRTLWCASKVRQKGQQ